MILFENVFKRYPNASYDALSDISFELGAGELTFLTGHSGAGKSTLLKLIMLTERVSRGQLLVNNKNLSQISLSNIPYHRRNLGVVFQNHQLLFDRSVFENVALPLQISGYSTVDIGRRVRAALDKVGLLSKEKMFPLALSGGEQQRVGIARAVVNKPRVLLADEPTGNLDPELSAEIMDLFQQFAQVGVCVVIATHDLSLIEQHDHHLLTLKDGRMIKGRSQSAFSSQQDYQGDLRG